MSDRGFRGIFGDCSVGQNIERASRCLLSLKYVRRGWKRADDIHSRLCQGGKGNKGDGKESDAVVRGCRAFPGIVNDEKRREKGDGKSKRQRVHILYFTPWQICEAAATSGISSTLMVLEPSMKNSRYSFTRVFNRFADVAQFPMIRCHFSCYLNWSF